ncbi:hypothetical protein LSM04_000107 [Trypanosoma melophagium]|uniref:uncharacterized protein n=1 Tax=Trypanosoma melophagium TaxID=715481 RepID=UPI00351A2971|nr:hypothetical protein LSM04_000107 [Trypanosoma melophagium]
MPDALLVHSFGTRTATTATRHHPIIQVPKHPSPREYLSDTFCRKQHTEMVGQMQPKRQYKKEHSLGTPLTALNWRLTLHEKQQHTSKHPQQSLQQSQSPVLYPIERVQN